MSNIINKITVKHVCGNIKNIAKQLEEGEKRPLMRVMGIVRKIEHGDGDYGPWAKFKGSFEAIEIATGEVFKSTACLLPPVAAELIEEAFEAEGVESLEFAFDIVLQEDGSSSVGYQYQVDQLIESGENDPMEQLSKSINKALPQLPSPSADKKPAAKSRGKKAA